jgi:hypothetical protein
LLETFIMKTFHLGRVFKRNEMGRASSAYGERRGAYRVLPRKHEEWRPLGRTCGRWVDKIKMSLQEVEWGHGLD